MTNPPEHIVGELKDRTPGPNTYMLPTLLGRKQHDPRKWQGPAFTMQGRRKPERLTDVAAAGPKYYQTSNITRYGAVGFKSLPPVVKGRRNEVRRGVTTPGPDHYDVTDGVKYTRLSKPPAFTMSGWSKVDPPSKRIPGPKYALPTYINGTGKMILDKASPAFTIKSRIPYKDFDPNTPGPQAYGAHRLTVTKRGIPELKILEKPSQIEKRDMSPGANRYDAMVNPIGKSGPAFSMASRFPRKVGTMRTKEDLGHGINGYCDLG